MKRLVAGALQLGIDLSPSQVDQFRRYRDELLAWNRKMNLTSITKPDDVETLHFLDSLSIVEGMPDGFERAGKLVDVGTGGGFPGIPLKLAHPELHLTLIEATAKKARFLTYLIGELGLASVEVVCQRAEDAARDVSHREYYGTVVARAVAPMATLTELTLPFCAVGGRVVAQKSGAIDEELARAETAITSLGGRLLERMQVSLPELEADRCLVVLEKIAPTPENYPRRAGVPAKRPLS
jgi:16S rRNA (guanine527-N7)-methyltransferase